MKLMLYCYRFDFLTDIHSFLMDTCIISSDTNATTFIFRAVHRCGYNIFIYVMMQIMESKKETKLFFISSNKSVGISLIEREN